jgi:NAD(P)-dependent dehydrogenase (short-subunit alcohol dehydrogenase family)
MSAPTDNPLSQPPPLAQTEPGAISMQGKTALVTGATNGVGRAFSHWLAARGAELIVTGRDHSKLQALQQELQDHYPGARVHPMQADQLHLDEVNELCKALAYLPRLDLLVNNAGRCPKTYQTSPEGFESAFTINYLSHKLLTLKLLPQLKKSRGYILHVTSSAMGGAQLDLDTVHSGQHFNGWQAYANSKLAMTLFSQLLAERLAAAGVRSNAVCPGMVKTNLIKGHPMFVGQEAALLEASKPPEEAADYLGWMISDASVNKLSGYYYSKGFNGREAMQIHWDRALAEELWAYSVKLLERFEWPE